MRPADGGGSRSCRALKRVLIGAVSALALEVLVLCVWSIGCKLRHPSAACNPCFGSSLPFSFLASLHFSAPFSACAVVLLLAGPGAVVTMAKFLPILGKVIKAGPRYAAHHLRHVRYLRFRLLLVLVLPGVTRSLNFMWRHYMG